MKMSKIECQVERDRVPMVIIEQIKVVTAEGKIMNIVYNCLDMCKYQCANWKV